ncbi:MAG TPA: succinyl-diaminopimelate desuccinylase [Burkholderiales bacterium]|nr:succinyl-diaminopimelate desuccinylase [Burkholderiales bacterium]
MNNPLSLCKALLERRSVTPDDAGCQELIVNYLKPMGFNCETVVSNGVTNLWARRGTGSPLVVFAGHTDVVPPGPSEAWHSDPFIPSIREGKLYGRGSADMKASLAAFVCAIDRQLTFSLKSSGSIGLLLTSDEEGPATNGTVLLVEMLKKRNEHIDYCIVGEPTSEQQLGDTIKNGRRGSLSGYLTVHGIQGHIAYPHLAINPIHGAVPALAELTRTEWDKGNDYFPPTSFQISNIHAGTGANNVIPDSLVAEFNFRFSPALTPISIKAQTESILNQHDLKYSLKWSLSGLPFLTPDGHLTEILKQAISSVTGITPKLSTSGGTSDGRFIIDICSQVVEFGPINSSIHKMDEYIDIEDIERLTEIYAKTLKVLLED